ncbi:MAG: autophagy protein atg9 [Trichoglossum hirsutum]|nr:MAG: autophagy protein atg9 [Trichoglossum hirsutum]
MMASNLLSRFLPPSAAPPSVYETIRQHDELSDTTDIEERAGLDLDDDGVGEGFEAYELEQAADDGNRGAADSMAFLKKSSPQQQRERSFSGLRSVSRPRWLVSSTRLAEADEEDDEVPASLLIEGGEEAAIPMIGGDRPPRTAGGPSDMPPIPGPVTRETRAHWEATQTQQRLHADEQTQRSRTRRAPKGVAGLAAIDPKVRAMWRWANVENLDNFLKDVYDYYLGHGIWCILLSRTLNLLTSAFVVGFSTFLSMCVNYKKVPDSKKMSEILVPQCTKKMSGSANFLLWLFTFFWIAKLFQYILDFRRLRQLHDFYLYLLEIPDTDLQTITWQEVVARLMTLRDSNPVTAAGIGSRNRLFLGSQSKQRMDAHDIANRLMRKENYLIALFNKDILDLTLPVPFLKNRQLFSRTLEWNLSLCILDYVFNEQGQIRSLFLKDTHRRVLSDGLRRRFLLAGFLNVLCAPFIVAYFMVLYFFRYFNEYQKNPSQIGSRQYTPLAEWKFREFNELWHLFQRRIKMSYPFASRYVDQFPKEKVTQLGRFVAFVTGALASVLALASVIDPELFLGFEITHDRTVLFYLGVFGTIWAVASGMVPEETLVFDPEYAINNVIEYTHYLPAQWRGRLHSDEVRKEFSMLYQMKVVIFIEEMLSIIFTPFVLWFSLPKCSDRLVDFFREFTVHVDGLGYVCSFAVFDFKKGGNNIAQQRQEDGDRGLRDDFFSTKDGKMLASYYGFLDNYATNPRAAGNPPLHPGTKRHFHPPPTFPGLMSPLLAADMNGPGAGRQDRWNRQDRHGSFTRPVPGMPAGHSMHARTPRFGGIAGSHISPMPSILLDPHHQPSNTGFRSIVARHSPHSTRQRRLLREETVEDEHEDDLPSAAAAQHHGTGTASSDSAGGLADESNLGESFMTTRAATRGDDDDDDEGVDGAAAAEKGTGVLGLLYQFQRAQTEGRGGGVNI